MNSNDYMKKYMIKRYHDRMNWARNTLGNICRKCGSVDNLEIDHIDPIAKSFTVGGQLWNCAKAKFEAEIAKCQLLCQSCHNKKTLAETGKKSAIGTHGTLSSYRYCKCYLCRKAKADWSKQNKSK